jgi:phosphate:Na+ symporter
MGIYHYSVYFFAGLAVFFLGQRILSQGLQFLGAKSVKKIVHDKNHSGALVNFIDGARLTFYAFSPTMSSMVITGLANSNLLKPHRVVPMLMGTLLGTSVVVTVLTFETHHRALYLIAAGLLLGLILHKFKYRSIGQFLVGLGLTFLGISVMEESFILLSSYHSIGDFLASLTSLSLTVSLLLFILVGLSLSLTLMSSTMVMAIVVVFSKLEILLPLQALALLIGTALSSLVMTFVSVKSHARAYSVQKVFVTLMSVSMAILITVLGLMFFAHFIPTNVSSLNMATTGLLVFALICFLVSEFLGQSFSTLAQSFYPEGEVAEQSKLKFLGEGRFLSSTMAYILVEMEVAKLMDIVNRMFIKCDEYLNSTRPEARLVAKIKDYERIIDNIQQEIDIFLQKVISSGSGENESKISINYLKLSHSLEQLADSLDKFSTVLTKFLENWSLTKSEREKLHLALTEVRELYILSYDIFLEKKKPLSEYEDHVERFFQLKKDILEMREFYALEHENDKPMQHIYYSDLVTSLAKIRGRVRDIFVTLH